MQKIKNICSFCNSLISQGQSLCNDCLKLYDIKIGNYESDGCGCDKWDRITDFYLGSEIGIINH